MMMRRTWMAALTLTTLVGVAQVETYKFAYNGKPYEVVKDKKTWEEAAADAVKRGGYLVEINDAQEDRAIFNAILNQAKVSTRYTSVSNGGGIAYVWIGATDKVSEGTWLWDGNNDSKGKFFWSGNNTGKAQDNAYNNWGGTGAGRKKEPDNYGNGQDCAAIGLTGWPSGTSRLGKAGEWNDIIGSSKLYYVVEYDRKANLEALKRTSSYLLYPNPCSQRITIQGQGIESVSFMDQTGKEVLYSVETDVDVTSLAPGLYFVSIRSGSRMAVEKVVVQ